MELGTLHSFFNGVGKFFSSLAHIGFGSLLLGVLCFAGYITVRTRAWYQAVHAAYPDVPVRWRELWAAYWATFAVNNVVPFRGGEAIRLVLGRSSVPTSSFPTIAATFFVEHVFDACLAVVTLSYAFTQGVFPKPPDFSKLGAFDLSFFAGHLRFTLFLITLIGVAGLVAWALLAARVVSFVANVRRGFTILRDRRRYFRQVWLLQLGGTVLRFGAYWCFLDAFHIGGSIHNVLLVSATNTIATALPLTPGGAGVQQALLLKIFSGKAAGATVAAYSVGQQISIAVTSVLLGAVGLFFVFGFRSFGEALRYARSQHAAGEEAHPVPAAAR